MRVFLTGASGFIGSHVARKLLAAGCEVAALVRPGSAHWRLHDITDQMTLLSGSLEDMSGLRPALAQWKPDACIHLAWYAEPGKYLNAPQNVPALVSSLRLLEELISIGCRKMVAVGTCAEYELGADSLREDGPTRPETLYAAAKLSFCLMGQRMAQAAGMDFVWARIFYLYGPDEDERRVVPAVIRALLAGQEFPATAGEQIRDYLHVEDVASALCTLAERGASGIYNICSGSPVTMRCLMETIGESLGRTDLIQFGALPYRDWEPRLICGDNQRLRSLGWQARCTLEEGLKETALWWKSRAENPAGAAVMEKQS